MNGPWPALHVYNGTVILLYSFLILADNLRGRDMRAMPFSAFTERSKAVVWILYFLPYLPDQFLTNTFATLTVGLVFCKMIKTSPMFWLKLYIIINILINSQWIGLQSSQQGLLLQDDWTHNYLGNGLLLGMSVTMTLALTGFMNIKECVVSTWHPNKFRSAKKITKEYKRITVLLYTC